MNKNQISDLNRHNARKDMLAYYRLKSKDPGFTEAQKKRLVLDAKKFLAKDELFFYWPKSIQDFFAFRKSEYEAYLRSKAPPKKKPMTSRLTPAEQVDKLSRKVKEQKKAHAKEMREQRERASFEAASRERELINLHFRQMDSINLQNAIKRSDVGES